MRFVDVLLLDIDGTIVGDVHYQVCQYEITNAVTRCSKNKANSIAYKRYLIEALKSGLLHPDLEMFLNQWKRKFEFFIYTASERKWTIMLVSCIEKILGTEFNRPLFTRDDCFGDNFTKNIDSVKVRVKKTIETFGDHVRVRNIYLIDNNKTLNRKTYMLIHCPSYDRKIYTDVFRNLREQVRLFWDHLTSNSNHETLGQEIINLLVHSYGLLPMNRLLLNSSYSRFMTFYESRVNNLKRINSQRSLTTPCWRIMNHEFKNIGELTVSDVKNINSSLDSVRN